MHICTRVTVPYTRDTFDGQIRERIYFEYVLQFEQHLLRNADSGSYLVQVLAYAHICTCVTNFSSSRWQLFLLYFTRTTSHFLIGRHVIVSSTY